MKKQNVTFSVGNLGIIEKANADFGFFREIFSSLQGKAKSFLPSVKLLAYNRLGECHAISRLDEFTPKELFSRFGANKPISDRTINRTLERLGEKAQFILANYQKFIKRHNLVSKVQNVDFSSSYFIGKECSMAKLGHSKDHRPGKPQINYGISIGENHIPTAMNIQNGNTVDPDQMNSIIRMCSKVLEKESLLTFDCGGNTKKNKMKIRSLDFHYLTLKPKKKGAYKSFISEYEKQKKEGTLITVLIGEPEQTYSCAKFQKGSEFNYIFFSSETKQLQLEFKKLKQRRKIEKNDKLLKKVRKGKDLKSEVCSEGYLVTHGSIQKCLTDEVPNQFINGVEGFFVLESSLDREPSEILRLYKDKDKAEKFIRDMKEGAETRPIRHWDSMTVKGYLLLIFLTNAMINLTLLKTKDHAVTNLKLLKKYLRNLTLTVFYPKNALRFEILSNNSAEMRSILGDFYKKYEDQDVNSRW